MQLEAEMKFAEWNEAVFYSFGARLQFQAVDFNALSVFFFFFVGISLSVIIVRVLFFNHQNKVLQIEQVLQNLIESPFMNR